MRSRRAALALAAICAAAIAGCGGSEEPRTRGPADPTFTATQGAGAAASEPEPRCLPARRAAVAPTGRDVRVAGLDAVPAIQPRTLAVAREITLRCLVWDSFGGATARARGVADELDCVPTCAQSGATRRAVRVVLSGSRPCRSRRFYSQVELVVGVGATADRPRGYLSVPCG